MNKRQKKKQVKRAIKNFVNFEDSKQDKVIMNTIGTNIKVRNELLYSYFLYKYAKAYIEKFMQVAGMLFDSVKSAITSIAQDLEMEPEELMKAADSLKKVYGISGSQAVELIVHAHRYGIGDIGDLVEEGIEIDTVSDQEPSDIHDSENEQEHSYIETADPVYKPSIWEKFKKKVKGFSLSRIKGDGPSNEVVENVNDSIY